MTRWWPARWVISMVLLGIALALLGAMGHGVLAPPPFSWSGAIDWVSRREPVDAAFALVRLAALAIGWYLLVVVAIAGIVRIANARAGSALFDRLTLGAARGLVGTIGLGAIAFAAAPAALAQVPSSSTAVIRSLDSAPTPPSASTAPSSTAASKAASTATIHALPDATAALVAPVAVAGDLWSVAAGESMWSIAVTHLRDVHGRDASDEEIAPYWRQIVAANALPNPDLLFVGQVIELPAVTPS
jgi:hypothetical protein